MFSLVFFFELARLLKPNGTAGSLLKPGDLSFQWSARGWAWPLGALHFVVVLVGRSFHLPQFTGSGDGGTWSCNCLELSFSMWRKMMELRQPSLGRVCHCDVLRFGFMRVFLCLSAPTSIMSTVSVVSMTACHSHSSSSTRLLLRCSCVAEVFPGCLLSHECHTCGLRWRLNSHSTRSFRLQTSLSS